MINIFAFYFVFGLAFSFAFAFMGVQKIDEQAKKASLVFRLLITPGVTVIWPYFMYRWLLKKAPPEECNAHRHLAKKKIL